MNQKPDKEPEEKPKETPNPRDIKMSKERWILKQPGKADGRPTKDN